MTPLGHLSFSYLIGNTSKKIYLFAFILGGIFPDIEFLLLPLPSFNHLHRLLAHNLLFIIVSAAIIGFFVKREIRPAFIVSFLMGCFFHLIIDACMDANPTNGIGIAFLWPFDDTYFSIINISQPIQTNSGWKEPFQMIKAVLPELKWEIPFYLAAVILLFKKTKTHLRLRRN